MNKQNRIVVPIRSKSVLKYGFKCAVYWWVFFMLLESAKTASPPPNWHLVLVIVLVTKAVFEFLCSLIHHTISEEGLVICFLNIPLRVVLWNQIRHATYLYAWIHTETRMDYGQIIVVSFAGCPRFFYETDSLYSYLPKHPFGATCIWLPPHDVSRYTEVFQSYFPALERQSQESAKRIKESRRPWKTKT